MQKSPQNPEEFEFLICDISNLWRKLLTQHSKEIGITTTEWRVLYAIVRFPGSTQVQIAQLVELEPQSLTRILDKLEQNCWIEKQASPQDRRAKCLYATDQSEEIISQIKHIGDKIIRPQALRSMKKDKASELIGLLVGVKNNLLAQIEKER